MILRNTSHFEAAAEWFQKADCFPNRNDILKGATMSDMLLKHIPSLRAYARSLCVNWLDADDLVEETLERAVEHASLYPPENSFRVWLFAILRNRFFINTFRKARNPTTKIDRASSKLHADAYDGWQSSGKEFQRAVDALPLHCREALCLVVVLQETHINAAKLVGCDVKSLIDRVCRSRQLLVAEMTEYA